uniref:Lon protease-like protein 1, mitochondrial n=1 Tax=Noccaea caerulescens TaxID=107243 RepID=A0A1J3JUB5_NOCCA
MSLNGKGASVEAPAFTFDAKSLAKTGSELPENPNDPEDPKVHLTHGQEDQSEIRAEVETVVTSESNIASYAVKPGLYEKLPVGVAVGLARTSIDGLAWYVKTTLVEEGEDIGCFKVMGQVGEKTSRSARIAYMVARQTLLENQPENIFFANSKLCVDFHMYTNYMYHTNIFLFLR